MKDINITAISINVVGVIVVVVAVVELLVILGAASIGLSLAANSHRDRLKLDYHY